LKLKASYYVQSPRSLQNAYGVVFFYSYGTNKVQVRGQIGSLLLLDPIWPPGSNCCFEYKIGIKTPHKPFPLAKIISKYAGSKFDGKSVKKQGLDFLTHFWYTQLL